jgi:hypothetical protein
MQQPLIFRDRHTQPLLMPHLPRTDGDSSCHDLRTCLLSPLSGLQHRIQRTLLPLPPLAKSITPHPSQIRRNTHRKVTNHPLRFLVPSGSEFIRYLCRTTDSAEWLKRRQIASYKLGLVVDFQDRCNIWRRGVIVNVLNNDRI